MEQLPVDQLAHDRADPGRLGDDQSGDTVHLHVERVAMRRSLWKFAARAVVEGKLVVEGEVTATMADLP